MKNYNNLGNYGKKNNKVSKSVVDDFETMTGKRELFGEEGMIELQNLVKTLIEYSYSQSNECFTLSLDIHAGVNIPHKTQVRYKLSSG